MRVTTAHFEAMREAIEPVDTEAKRTLYREAGLSDQRYRWDLLWQATSTDLSFQADLIENYADEHLDTALRRIVPDLVP